MNAIARIADGVAALAGARRLLLAFVGGGISAAAFAPLNFFPALLLGYAVLVVLLDGTAPSPHPLRAAFGCGWAFCLGQFLIGWHWIGYAFLVDPTNHLWQMPFALVFLTLWQALYGAVACALTVYLRPRGAARLLVFAVLMSAGDWTRGHLFTGFPWNLPAYGWGASLALMQSASLMGAYGLSFITILLGASLADAPRGRWRMPAIMLAVFAALWAFGAWRLAVTPQADVPNMLVRLVQPDIPQREKFVRTLMLRNWQRLVTLSIQPDGGSGHPTHIIWPEAATGFAVARSPGALDQIGLFTARGQTIITGSLRVDRGPDGRAWYNTLYVFPAGGDLPSLYDKFHLVPFGEYVPFARMLNSIGISQLTVGEGLSAGDHPHVLPAPGAPSFTPLICYEVIFPGQVTDPAAPRPGWLVNVTDDSWFGPWAGPRQHLLTARMRAIEEGLPIARAANTGISAMIDPLGRVRASLALNSMGVVDARLPAALPPTLYARFGNLIFLLLLVTAAFAAGLLGFFNRRRQTVTN